MHILSPEERALYNDTLREKQQQMGQPPAPPKRQKPKTVKRMKRIKRVKPEGVKA